MASYYIKLSIFHFLDNSPPPPLYKDLVSGPKSLLYKDLPKILKNEHFPIYFFENFESKFSL